MGKFRYILVIMKCGECGHENTELIPIVINEVDWRKTKKKYDEMIKESI